MIRVTLCQLEILISLSTKMSFSKLLDKLIIHVRVMSEGLPMPFQDTYTHVVVAIVVHLLSMIPKRSTVEEVRGLYDCFLLVLLHDHYSTSFIFEGDRLFSKQQKRCDTGAVSLLIVISKSNNH